MIVTMNAILREEDVMNPNLTSSATFGLTEERGLEILSHVSTVSEDGGNKVLYFMEYVNTLTDQEKLYMMYVGSTTMNNMLTAQLDTLEALFGYAMQGDK